MKKYLYFSLFVTILMVTGCKSYDYSESKKPNILFFLIDDQRNDVLGCAGHPIVQTPTVDHLAENGVRFTHAYVTTSICAASRASIFTGLYESRHNYTFGKDPVMRQFMEASYPFLLKKAGYRTGFIGKFGIRIEDQKQMLPELFDYYKPSPRSVPHFIKLSDGTRRHSAEIKGDQAIEFINEQTPDQPFCLSVSFNAVHAVDGNLTPGNEGHYPYPKAVADLYEDMVMPPPDLSDPEIFNAHPDFLKESMNRVRYFWRWDTEEKYQTNLKAYFRMISGYDQVMKRVIQSLEENGLADETVIVYSADNGYYMGNRGFAGKWTHYEESLRVPLIIFDPRLPEGMQGKTRDEMVLNLDIPATLLDLAGIEIPDIYQGKSLLPALANERKHIPRDHFMIEHRMDNPIIPKYVGIHEERYVYANYYEQQPAYEFLHDLKKDPDELVNLATDPDYAELLDEMRSKTGQTELPNILIVSADDLAYNSVGVFGCEVNDITPNIDRLASQGIRFANAHVNTPVCQPCRQSWLTGRFPHTNGAEGFEPIDDDVTTLPEMLKKAGYLNGILGKEIHHQPREKFYWDFIPFANEVDSTYRKGNSRDPSLFHTYSLKFFEQAKREGKPFFLSANSHDPHRPFIGSRQDTLTWGDHMPPVSRQYAPDEIDVLGYLPDIPDVRKEVAQYYGNVYRCDQNIGAVLDALDESGLADNTVVFFLSDHGAAFPFSKAQCYLNSSKTPLIIRWPEKIKPGSFDQENFIMTIDLMPTIMDIVGLPQIPGVQGRSFLPLLEGQIQQDREYAFTSFYQIFARIRYPMRCVQNENFGYIYNFWSNGQQEIRGDATGGLTWKAMNKAAETDPEIAKRVELYRYRVPEEFYDFKNDPDALVNLVDNPAYADELEQFRQKMLDMMKKYDDPAYETFKNRNQPGAIEQFMKAQKEKAKNTKSDEKF